jgi:hypothetical protein
MKKSLVLSLGLILFLSIFVFAKAENSQNGNLGIEASNYARGASENASLFQERIQEREQLREFFGEELEKVMVQNQTREYTMNNGQNKTIKVMPEVASERAIEALKLRNCNETQGCQIELKEVGQGNQTRLVYEMQSKRQGRFLGLFKTEIKVNSEIDVETGEVSERGKSWWAFLVRE